MSDDRQLDCEGDHGHHDHDLQPEPVVDQAASMASAMGDSSRLRILELLFDQPHCVSELAEETDDSMSTVSQRLKVLHSARLISRERDGKHIYYSLSDDHVRNIVEQLFVHSAE